MKKILAIALALLTLLLAVSCSGNDQSNADDALSSDYVAPDYTYQPSVSEKDYKGHKDSVFTFADGIGDTVIIVGYKGPYMLHEVVIPDSIGDRAVVGIGEKAFYYCTTMTAVSIPDSVTYIGNNAFTGCEALKEITVPAAVTEIGISAFLGCISLEKVTLKNGELKTIGNYAFKDCVKLSELALNKGLESIGDAAFWGCKALKRVIVPQSVKTIGDMAYYNCDSLNYRGCIFVSSGVKDIGEYAFATTDKTYITAPRGSYAYEYIINMADKEV